MPESELQRERRLRRWHLYSKIGNTSYIDGAMECLSRDRDLSTTTRAAVDNLLAASRDLREALAAEVKRIDG